MVPLSSCYPGVPTSPSHLSTLREAYVAATEEACSELPPMKVDELRADTSHLLRIQCPHNKTNISKEEYKAIKELREDQTREVLAVDKGVAMVVMDKQDYTNKALTLLTHQNLQDH